LVWLHAAGFSVVDSGTGTGVGVESAGMGAGVDNIPGSSYSSSSLPGERELQGKSGSASLTESH